MEDSALATTRTDQKGRCPSTDSRDQLDILYTDKICGKTCTFEKNEYFNRELHKQSAI